MTFGQQLKEKRKEKGLTTKQVGERAGMSRQAYEFYERDINVPTLTTAQKLASAIGFEFNYELGTPELPADAVIDNLS